MDTFNQGTPDSHTALLDSLLNHLALPPQLPHRQDPNIPELEREVVERLISSSSHLRDLPDNKLYKTWDSLYRSLEATKRVNSGGRVDRVALTREFRTLNCDEFMVIYVRAQNCALFIRRLNDPDHGPSVLFEAFEASARNEDVLAADNALQWDFPGSAVMVSLSTLIEDGFISNLCNFLEHASRESVKDFAAHSFKAGTTVFEYRNTPEPGLITSMLMSILQENGRQYAPKRLQKRVRDDCLWENASKPWRRLPYWLVLRVSVARYLSLKLGGEGGRAEYKFLLAHLLGNFLATIQTSSPDITRLDFLKKKICRRLVKLDIDKGNALDSNVMERFEYLFRQLEPGLKNKVYKASAFIDACWKQQKLSMSKVIPLLPRWASPEDLRLDLRVSRRFLQSVLTGYTRPRKRDIHHGDSVTISEAAKKHLNEFARSQFKLMETEIECKRFCALPQELSMEELITSASLLVARHLEAATTEVESPKGPSSTLCNNMPELKSALILNILELWVKMDLAACNLFPLLKDFHPLLYPDLLDVLLASQSEDMKRVLSIQRYLQTRISVCEGTKFSIFDDPTRGCFGHRFYEEPSSVHLTALHEAIEDWAKERRTAKEEEWKAKTEKYTILSRKVDESSCIFVVDDDNPLSRGYHDSHCPRCEMLDQLSEMRIQAYEHPLPSEDAIAKAVIFELACPPAFALYRDTTWRIITQLALPYQEESMKPKCIIREYMQLQRFANSARSSFSLASTTKSFLTTHYSSLSFPIDWESGKDGVCRPNGLKLGYFDSKSSMWPGRCRRRLTLTHHVKLELPKNSPFSKLLHDPAFSDNVYGSSSYEIMATVSACPTGINVHEYLAFQTIASGKSRRWLSILTELGSANLNFSNEATMLLLKHLTLQCGPLGSTGSFFRLIHAVFLDEVFCEKLAIQLQQRLESLSTNWRENHLMDTIITLSLRLFDFAAAAQLNRASAYALSLLDNARNTCVRWFKLLRVESYKATDSETAQRCQQYALWAALLCKQTYATQIQRPQYLEDSAVETFIQSSIIVQNNLVVKLNSLPSLLQHAVIRDLRLSYALRDLISDSISTRPNVFASSLKEIWPEEEGCSRRLTDIRLGNDHWVCCLAIAGSDTIEQLVYYNYVEGMLLVDGRTIGKLPKDPTKSLVLNELFGNQALLTYPSNKNGMDFLLCVCPYRFQVHIGSDEHGGLVIRAFRDLYSLQLIDRETFRKESSWDLPGPLLDDCFHWLNLRTGEVYITRKGHPWPRARFSGWVLNVNQQSCTRSRMYKGKVTRDTVISTYSQLFSRATRILESFEYVRYLLVFQPGGGRYVQIELPRLQILFHVNEKHLLESPQLQCEIDPDQDAGTWYGLRTKLVCRSSSNPAHRTILVPRGRVAVERKGCHVLLRIEPNGQYARYTINDILGRIDCAAEPVLVYWKAFLHAYTSFLIPDPLTGRTGAEEAIQWLLSGISQPWASLGPGALDCLAKIAKLTPRRDYYPPALKVMRTDHWGESIPVSLQRSEFRSIVDQILQTSNDLKRFELTGDVVPELSSIGDPHLHARAIIRSQDLERSINDAVSQVDATDRVYGSRDRLSHKGMSMRRRNVLEVTHLLQKRPQKLNTTTQLAQALTFGNSVGGFGSAFDKVSLNDRLKVDIVQNWGSLVKFAQLSSNRFELMFLLGPISFRLDADMSLIRTLVAFSGFNELRNMDLPPWDEYKNFQLDQVPQLGSLQLLLRPFQVPYPENDTTVLEEYSSAKQRKRLRVERSKYELQVEDDSRLFANLLLSQWPCLEPDASGLLQSVLIDVCPALEAIRPEWRRLRHNMDLARHVQEVQVILNQRTSEKVFDPPSYVVSEDRFSTRVRGKEVVGLHHLLLKPVSVPSNQRAQLATNIGITRSTTPISPNELAVRSSKRPNEAVNPDCTLLDKTTKISRNMSDYLGGHAAFPRNSRLRNDPDPEQSIPERDRSLHELEDIAKRFESSHSVVKTRYARDLQQSLETFRQLKPPMTTSRTEIFSRSSQVTCGRSRVSETFEKLKLALDSPTPGCSSRRIEWLKAGNLWPIISKSDVLGQLGSLGTQKRFGSGMRECLLKLGVEITQLQREIRLYDLALKGEAGRYCEEASNEGHSNWIPGEHPDWLLLEIESNMMIRPVQVDVALATISPKSESNSVLQMNMGQGKTSCIIPMVAATLADKKQLVRVIVPKALLQQTAQLLHSKLGGILRRQLRHVGFSRRTPTTEENIRAFHAIHKDILKSAGVMLCQPDHILSFKLSGQQRLLDNQIGQAGPMINVQSWLKRVARDILDESDYTLAVRTQLIYPSGSQTSVDGHPHRWQVVEAVLRLVDGHMVQLPYAFPHSIVVIRRLGGGFPLIHFLRQDVEKELMRRVTVDIFQGLGGILPMDTNALPGKDRVAIKDFISSTRPRAESIERIRTISPDRPSIRQTVYLLRGLLVNRILMMTLKKRWNVEYGLHPNREPIAVPFHAKGVPSDQSEWGHPDVAILFTCLAFYYDGVSLAQLRQCLEHVLKSDDPSTEYDKWTQSTDDFPTSLRAWNSINVDDEVQLCEIWKAVRYNPVVIDHFLNNFVFPRHAKQFKVKLQSNGWDIPLSPISAEVERNNKSTIKPLTTGFSGTNDNRTMLPLNIKQQDLPSLQHTSAEVLTYLLHSRNRDCVLFSDLPRDPHVGRASEKDLLFGLKRRSIRVLIDAGAQILEMDNVTLAEEWLKIDVTALAALYFDQGNRPWVVTRQGQKTPLLASPFADDLSQCLVYLDEAHTRGTDLRLPIKARGALTLRLGQTKDHTVQAAMRLRQLGTTQAITFFIPPEVHQNIADLREKTIHESLDSVDVIEWLLENTCEAIEQFQPLYYSQGMNWCRRTQAELDNPDFLTDKSQREVFIDAIKQEEQQTLQQLYEPKSKTRAIGLQTSTNHGLRGFIKELNSRRKTFQDTGGAVHASALQEVEQEREVAFEVESVRQVKKPKHYPAHSFPGLHPSLESFARTGRTPADAHYFIHVMNSLSKTAVGRKFKISRTATDSKLFVTAEFDRTVKLNLDLTMDNFIRPVNWILWSPHTETAIVIIPEEAEALIPILRDRALPVETHLLLYAAPITRKMLHFNDLNYYSIPPLPRDWIAPNWLRIELGIYAGRLYFEWREYESMCKLLGVEEGVSTDQEVEFEAWVTMDGNGDGGLVDLSQTTPQKQDERRLAERPLTFIQEWLTIRRRGQDFVHSPMGFVSQGKSLQRGHLFFQEATQEAQYNHVFAPVIHQPLGSSDNDEDYDDGADDYHGVDDMGANEGAGGEVRDDCLDRFVYNDSALVDADEGCGFGVSTSESDMG